MIVANAPTKAAAHLIMVYKGCPSVHNAVIVQQLNVTRLQDIIHPQLLAVSQLLKGFDGALLQVCLLWHVRVPGRCPHEAVLKIGNQVTLHKQTSIVRSLKACDQKVTKTATSTGLDARMPHEWQQAMKLNALHQYHKTSLGHDNASACMQDNLLCIADSCSSHHSISI